MITIKFDRRGLQKAEKRLPREIALEAGEHLEAIAHIIHNRVHANTPVYEGRAVANFQWRMDAPFVGVIEPVGNDPPGRTSQMELGEESRRSINREISDASLARIDFKKLRKLYLTNNVPYFDELEYGRAGDPEFSRTPSTGIFRAAMAEVRMYLARHREKVLRFTVKE